MELIAIAQDKQTEQEKRIQMYTLYLPCLTRKCTCRKFLEAPSFPY